MASQDRTAQSLVALYEALAKQPHRFGFFQAIRRIECLHRDKPRLGESTRVVDDPVRLSQEPSLAFAPATLASFETTAAGPPRLVQRFLGIFGPNGPLPLHLTEYARQRRHNEDDPTFARFADLFHHRMISLFYRAWAHTEPTVSFDRPQSDQFAKYTGSLFGLGMASFRRRDAMPDSAKLYYAGRLVGHTRHPEGLRAMLSGFFRLPAEVVEWIGHWIELPHNCRLRLGQSPMSGVLGVSATIGDRIWNCQHKFRIVLGPVDLVNYQRLLPGGDSLQRLVALVRNYLGDELLWEVNLILKAAEVPPIQLGMLGQLGWTTWLGSAEKRRHDADDLCLIPLANTTLAP